VGTPFCGIPSDDDWGYFINPATRLKIAIALTGVALGLTVIAESRRRVRGAAALGIIAVMIMGWPLLTWEPIPSDAIASYRTPYLVGEIASTIRCPDRGCGHLSVEEVVVTSGSRYPMAYEYWNLIRDRVDRGGFMGSIRSYFLNRFGDSAVL
jgi:hypothetical protein